MIFAHWVKTLFLDKRSKKALPANSRTAPGFEILEKRDLPAAFFGSSNLAALPCFGPSQSTNTCSASMPTPESSGQMMLQNPSPSSPVTGEMSVEWGNANFASSGFFGQPRPNGSSFGITGEAPPSTSWVNAAFGLFRGAGGDQSWFGSLHPEKMPSAFDNSWSFRFESTGWNSYVQAALAGFAALGNRVGDPPSRALASAAAAVQTPVPQAGAIIEVLSASSILPLINIGAGTMATKPVLSAVDLVFASPKNRSDILGDLRRDFAPALEGIYDRQETQGQAHVPESGKVEPGVGGFIDAPWLAEFISPVLSWTPSASLGFIQQLTGPPEDFAAKLRAELTFVFSSPWFISTLTALAGAEICRRRIWRSGPEFNLVVEAPDINGPKELLERYD
jgi:hypothetical protein